METNACYMREIREEDAHHIYTLNSDPLVIRFTGEYIWRPEDADHFARNYARLFPKDPPLYLAFLKESKEFVGWIGCRHYAGRETPDISLRLLSSHWHQGLGAEILEGFLKYYREKEFPFPLVAQIHPENIFAKRLFLGAGFGFIHYFLWEEEQWEWWELKD